MYGLSEVGICLLCCLRFETNAVCPSKMDDVFSVDSDSDSAPKYLMMLPLVGRR
jgi:hypothetical protein